MMFPSLNIRHLRAIHAVMTEGSVSAATRIVHLTQPALTQGIVKVETRLGVQLFYRRPSGMAATDAAGVIGPRIARVLDLIGERHITTTQVNAFLSLAKAGGYAKAASLSGLTEPSLHRAVSALSASLGYALAERRGRGVMLTPRGEGLARRFRMAAAEMKSALEELDYLAGRESGRITIGAMPLSRARLLPAAVTSFHRRHPAVDVRIIEGSRAELIGGLRDGSIDVLVGALRLPTAPEADVAQTFLFEDRPVIIGRAGHPLSGVTKPTSDDLRRHAWIVSASDTPLRAQWETMFQAVGADAPHVPIECSSVMMVRQMLLASDLLTLLSPEQLAVELQAGILVRVAEAPGDLSRHIGLSVRTEWKPAPLHSAFIQILKEEAELMARPISNN
jgi:LysR family transcriptional regulator of gallate degradation